VIVNGDGNSVDKSDRIASNSDAVTSVEKDNDKSVLTDTSQHDSGWVDSNDTNNSINDSYSPPNNSINSSYNPDNSVNDLYNAPTE
jgi:hypothetical protein